MTAQIDVWRAAGIMINRYGDTAHLEACRSADELGDKGARAGVRTRLRILRTFEACSRERSSIEAPAANEIQPEQGSLAIALAQSSTQRNASGTGLHR
jgi:hypothetical protein